MASKKLTDYERQRLENIKRNEEMLASFNIQSTVDQLSAATKRHRVQSKSFKISPEKKLKSETPIIIRRSLRTRGMPPDPSTATGLQDDLDETLSKTRRSLEMPILTKSPREQGPLRTRDVYCNTGSDENLLKMLRIIRSSIGDSKEGVHGDSCNLNQKMPENDSIDVKLEEENIGLVVPKPENDDFNVKLEEENMAAGLVPKPENVNWRYPLRVRGSTDVKLEEKNIAQVVPKPENDNFRCPMKVWGSIDVESLKLKEENIARVVPGRIMGMCLFPSAGMNMVVVGNKFGNVGFWNIDSEKEDGDGIYLYHPHQGPVGVIAIHPSSPTKIVSCCYDGFIRMMDVEKEAFELLYSSEDAIFSASIWPNNAKSLYFGEGHGRLSVLDERVGKLSTWNLHDDRINTIDFNPENTNLMATSSTDNTVSIWDLRKITAHKPISLRTLGHKRAVHSAYFSPSGRYLATTSIDDKVGLLSGVNFEDTSMIYHNNQTGRWISRFRAIWGWDDSSLFIGNMKRGVDVISVEQRKCVATLGGDHMTAIPCRFDAHPCKVGMLAGATSGGQVYVWTP